MRKKMARSIQVKTTLYSTIYVQRKLGYLVSEFKAVSSLTLMYVVAKRPCSRKNYTTEEAYRKIIQPQTSYRKRLKTLWKILWVHNVINMTNVKVRDILSSPGQPIWVKEGQNFVLKIV